MKKISTTISGRNEIGIVVKENPLSVWARFPNISGKPVIKRRKSQVKLKSWGEWDLAMPPICRDVNRPNAGKGGSMIV